MDVSSAGVFPIIIVANTSCIGCSKNNLLTSINGQLVRIGLSLLILYEFLACMMVLERVERCGISDRTKETEYRVSDACLRVLILSQYSICPHAHSLRICYIILGS